MLGCILTVIYNIHVVNSTLQALTDFDLVVLTYGVWVRKGIGEKNLTEFSDVVFAVCQL